MGAVISLFVVLYNVILYAIALSKRKVSTLLQYSFYVFSLIGWVTTLYIYDSIGASPYLLLVSRINVVFSFLLAYSFFEFFLYFPYKFKINEAFLSSIRLFAVFLTAITLFTPYIDQSELIIKGVHKAAFGSLFPLFVLYILGIITYAVYIILNKIRQSSGEDKVKLYYLITGGMLSIIFMVLTQLVLPLIFDVYAFMVVGSLSLIFMTYYMTLVVTRREFHNFKITLITIGHRISLFIFYIVLFYLLVISSEYFFKSPLSSNGIVYISFMLLILVSLSDPIYNFLHKVWEKAFHYDIGKLSDESDEIVKNMGAIYNTGELINTSLKELNRHFEVKKTGVLVYNKGQVVSFGGTFEIDIDESLESILSAKKVIYVYDKSLNTSIKEKLQNAHISFIYLLNLKLFSKGYFIVGEKEQRNFFDIEEQKRMSKIIEFLSMAIERALFFEENNKLVQNLGERVKEATRELQDKYDKEKELLAQERDMLDIMGHELRTPATIIKLASRMLEKSVKGEDISGKTNLHRIEETIEREIKLINTLINTAKVDNDKLELTLAPVYLDSILKAAVEDTRGQAEEKGLSISYERLTDDIPLVLADEARIREVIDNLITNSIKYTDEGYIKASIYADETEVVVCIEDSGEGIKADDQDELFKKFKRVNPYTQTSKDSASKMVRPGGTGLGLYVSKAIVAMHKGRIWVESEEGKGSKFKFALPLPKHEDLEKYENAASHTANMFKKMGLIKEL